MDMDNVNAMLISGDGPDGRQPRRSAYPGAGRPAAESARVTPVRTIWNRRWRVLLCVVICVVAAGLYATLRPKTYTRSTQLAIEPASAKAIGDGMNIDAYLNTQAELIGGSTAIHLETLALLKDHGHWPLKMFPLAVDPVDAIKKDLLVTPGRNDHTVTLQFNSRYPDEAAYVLQALVQAYTEFTTDQKKGVKDDYDNAVSDNERLAREIQQKNAKLAEVESDLSLLQARQDLSTADNRILVALADEVKNAHIRAINAKGEYERAAKSLIPDRNQLDELITSGKYLGQQVVADQDQAQAKSELYLAQAHLKELSERYLPNHPAVQAAQHKVDDLTAAYVMAVYRDWQTASSREKDFESSYEQQKKRAYSAAQEVRTRISRQQAAATNLKQEIEQARKVTDGLAKRITTTLEQLPSARVQVISEADPNGPPDRVFPNRNHVLIEGLLAGLVLGIALAFADQRVRSIAEVSAAASLPVLGVIPRVPRSQGLRMRGRRVHVDPMSDVAEAYRAVRTGVFFGTKARSIVVTSAERAEGRSTLASNLAIALTEAGHHVLLMDGDMRAPAQHRIFGADNDVGVSSIVSGRAALERAIYATGVRNLELMPCGPIPFNPSETINNQVFASLLAELRNRYDYVVIDSPPIMAFTEGRILGAMCDQALLVVRADRSNRRAIADARDGLLGFGANVFGVVVNDGARDRQRYGYYGEYGLRNRDMAVPQRRRALLGASGLTLEALR